MMFRAWHIISRNKLNMHATSLSSKRLIVEASKLQALSLNGTRRKKLAWLASFYILIPFFFYEASANDTYEPPKNWEFIILSIYLDRYTLSDATPAYQSEKGIYLPLGELCYSLSLAIEVDPINKSAKGFIIKKSNNFFLNYDRKIVKNKKKESFDPTMVKWIDNDLYVSKSLLEKWFPLRLTLNQQKMRLEVESLEALPIQSRMARQKKSNSLKSHTKKSYNFDDIPYYKPEFNWIDMPSLDHSLSLSSTINPANNKNDTNDTSSNYNNWSYSGNYTGIIADMDASLYVSAEKSNTKPVTRLYLSSDNRQSGAFGFIKYRNFQVGEISIPSVNHVMRSSSGGVGVYLSSRNHSQAMQNGSYSLRGPLPNGWDASLYFNDALIDYQDTSNYGQYEFLDIPLIFGTNEFRVELNGPTGERKIETKTLQQDRNLLEPLDFYYSYAWQRDIDRAERSFIQMDIGILKNLSGSLSISEKKNLEDSEKAFFNDQNQMQGQKFYNINLLSSFGAFLVNTEWVSGKMKDSSNLGKQSKKSNLLDINIRSKFRQWSYRIGKTQFFDAFSSEVHQSTTDGPLSTLSFGADGVITPLKNSHLPFSLRIEKDNLRSKQESIRLDTRLSGYWMNTHWTKSLSHRKRNAIQESEGGLQVSKNFFGLNLSGQINYQIDPKTTIESIQIRSNHIFLHDMNSPKSYARRPSRLTWSLEHNTQSQTNSLSVGFNRSQKHFSFSFDTTYSSTKELSLNLNLTSSTLFDSNRHRFVTRSQPVTSNGIISALVFLDENMNGQKDPNERPIPNIGFKIGIASRSREVTDDNGIAIISNLRPYEFSDIQLDDKTLEDPYWFSMNQGEKVLPRPGHTQKMLFPIVVTGEIDGTVFLEKDGETKGIGNARVELVDRTTTNSDNPVVIATARSASDGFYLFSNVIPGEYELKISSLQLSERNLECKSSYSVSISPKGDVIYGKDFLLKTPKTNNE